MIIGIGIDAVEIARFAAWQEKPAQQLRRIFSEQEIAYCLSVSQKSAERFAARFAAREALLKALSSINSELSLLQISGASSVIAGCPPTLHVDWQRLRIDKTNLMAHVSLSHTKTDAYAIVVVEQS